MSKVKFSVYIDSIELEKFKELAIKHCRSMSAEINMLIKEANAREIEMFGKEKGL